MGVVSGLTRLVSDKENPCQGVGGPPRQGAHSLWKLRGRANVQIATNADGSSVFPECQCCSRRCRESATIHLCRIPSRSQRDGRLTIVTQLCLSRVSLSPSSDQESHSRYARIRHRAAALSFQSVSAMLCSPAARGVCRTRTLA